MKVLHLPTEVGGNAFGLSSAEKRIGIDSHTLVKSSSWLNYPADTNLNLSSYKSRFKRAWVTFKSFLKVRNKYDVYHFNFGSSLIDPTGSKYRLLDLPFYNKKAKLIMTYNGCDVRQKFKTMETRKVAACHEENCYGGMCNSGELDKRRVLGVNKANKYVSHFFYLNPDLAKFLPEEKSSFLPYTIAGWDKIEFQERRNSNGVLRVVHAPTNRVTKGTKYLIDAVEKINADSKRIDLVLIENIPYEQALKEYQKADIIVDQLLIGWYGAFAVEAMKMGVPVACFINESDLHRIPSEMKEDLRSSILNVNQFNIKDKLESLLGAPRQISELSINGNRYVSRWHDPLVIANQVREIYSFEELS